MAFLYYDDAKIKQARYASMEDIIPGHPAISLNGEVYAADKEALAYFSRIFDATIATAYVHQVSMTRVSVILSIKKGIFIYLPDHPLFVKVKKDPFPSSIQRADYSIN